MVQEFTRSVMHHTAVVVIVAVMHHTAVVVIVAVGLEVVTEQGL